MPRPPIRLGLDLDGVIFDFNTHYVNLAKQRYPQIVWPTVDHQWPDDWDYANEYLTKDQDRALWKEIRTSDFWYTCPRYRHSSNLLATAYDWADELYFITSRPGSDVQWHTQEALKDVYPDLHFGGVIPTPNAEAKIPIINALRLTHFIDDKKETVRHALEQCPHTNIACWDQPWNRSWNFPIRLSTIEGFELWLSS